MTIIEGIGDEVIQVIALCLVTIICIIAWKSTAIRELPQIRTVLILERRSQSTTNPEETRVQAQNATIDTGQTQSDEPSPVEPNVAADTESISQNTVTPPSPEVQNDSTQETPNFINARRLSYFANSSQSRSNENSSDAPQASGNDESIPSTSGTTESVIRIKLKYLNDDQKIVQGKLQELLGEFKRRYFEAELSNNKSVLLIFQGRVLNEEQTLQTIGMYDNCVVHCLVKSGTGRREGNGPQGNASDLGQDAEWNLGTVLSTTVSVMLVSAWLAHVSYPQFFTITTTSTLICLTALFTISMIGLHFPEFLPS